MKKIENKLFVWEDVLCDYTSGMAFAIAPDLETALKILNEKAGFDLNLPISKLTILSLTKPEGFYVWGGG